MVDPAFSYKGSDVVQMLERICRDVGYPKVIRVDQGSEFISRDLDLWAYQNAVTLDFSRPGKPTDNAFIESFNGTFRAECLRTYGASAPSPERKANIHVISAHASAGGEHDPAFSVVGGGSHAVSQGDL